MKANFTLSDLDELEKTAFMLQDDFVNDEWDTERQFVIDVIGLIADMRERIESDQKKRQNKKGHRMS